MGDADEVKRFLDRNPDEVIILFVGDYVSSSDTERVFREAGLFDRLYPYDPTKAPPTLAQLIDARQNLLLLSGGERAMTALALLFALLRVKPSPFCVMDEIDAALDAANTDRFADMLREFAERSQFIVITHNPRTMEKADVLHGITMQEPGCSKLISVELEQAQKEAEQRQAAG